MDGGLLTDTVRARRLSFMAKSTETYRHGYMVQETRRQGRERSSGLPGTASALCTGGWAREGPRRHGGRAPADGSASEKRNRVRCRMEAIFDFLPQFSSVQSLSLV